MKQVNDMVWSCGVDGYIRVWDCMVRVAACGCCLVSTSTHSEHVATTTTTMMTMTTTVVQTKDRDTSHEHGSDSGQGRRARCGECLTSHGSDGGAAEQSEAPQELGPSVVHCSERASDSSVGQLGMRTPHHTTREERHRNSCLEMSAHRK